MMATRRTFAGLLALVAAGSGCSDDGTALRIQPFEQSRIEIQVNQSYNLKMRLSTKVSDKTYVDIDNAEHALFVDFPEFVIFKAGENLQVVEIRGLAVTPTAKGQYMTVKFTLRENSASQSWQYRVAGSSDSPPPPPPPPPADTGPPPPDSGAPDTAPSDSTPPDTAAPDTAPDAT